MALVNLCFETFVKNFSDFKLELFCEVYVSMTFKWSKKIIKFDKFFLAEEYHQDYYSLNSNEPYCSFVINPKIQKLKKKLNKYYKWN